MTQPDPRLGFTTRSGSKALGLLAEALKKRAGLVVVNGETGVGKTTFLRKFVLQQREAGQAAFAPAHPATSVDDLLKNVCAEAGVRPSGNDRIAHLYALREHAETRLKSGDTCAIVADNADTAPDAMLRDLALLVELERSNMRPIQVVLAGTPRIIDRLNTAEFNAARKEVGAIIKLEPFERDETGAYLQHCLTSAGYRGPSLFSFAAVERIHTKTRGVPRAINQIAVSALAALKRAGSKLSPDAIDTAVAEALAVKVEGVADAAPPSAPIAAPIAPSPPVAPPDSSISLPSYGGLVGQSQTMTVRMMLDKLDREFSPAPTASVAPPAPAAEAVALAPSVEVSAPPPPAAAPSPAPAPATPEKDAVIEAAARSVAPPPKPTASPPTAAPAPVTPPVAAEPEAITPAKPAAKPIPSAAELVARALEEVDAAEAASAPPPPPATAPAPASAAPSPAAPIADSKPHNSARRRLLARLTGR